MKNVRLFALIALALTLSLTGCKKADVDNSSKLFGTNWYAEETEDNSLKILEYEVFISFKEEGQSFQMVSSETETPKGGDLAPHIIVFDGMFTCINENLKMIIYRVTDPDMQEDVPIVISGSYKGDKIILHREEMPDLVLGKSDKKPEIY